MGRVLWDAAGLTAETETTLGALCCFGSAGLVVVMILYAYHRETERRRERRRKEKETGTES